MSRLNQILGCLLGELLVMRWDSYSRAEALRRRGDPRLLSPRLSVSARELRLLQPILNSCENRRLSTMDGTFALDSKILDAGPQ